MRCCGCLGEFDETAGPTHPYMLSSPGCWALYGELLAAEYSEPARMRLHRLTVDTYAVQHPGVECPAARRSVAVHLSRLHLLLERGWPMARANRAMLAITAAKDTWAWLEPPPMQGTLTVRDVVGAGTVAEHERRVQVWAESVWAAWTPHHAAVRMGCARLQS